MLAKLRSKLTYANVVATSALFFALGGGAYAVTAKKNSVRSSSIKNGQVANADLRSNAVTGPKVRNNSLTGADVDEASLRGVKAGSVSGLQVRKIRYDAPFNDVDPYTEVLNLGGLKITAACRAFGDNLDVKATTTKNLASIFVASTNTLDPNDTDAFRDIDGEDFDQGQFQTTDVLEVDNNFPHLGYGVGTIHYEAPDGSVVVVQLALSDTSGASSGCTMTGVAIGA